MSISGETPFLKRVRVFSFASDSLKMLIPISFTVPSAAPVIFMLSETLFVKSASNMMEDAVSAVQFSSVVSSMTPFTVSKISS